MIYYFKRKKEICIKEKYMIKNKHARHDGFSEKDIYYNFETYSGTCEYFSSSDTNKCSYSLNNITQYLYRTNDKTIFMKDMI